MDALNASPGVIILTTSAWIAALYAFVCQIREERVARAAVRRVREQNPAAWQSLSWGYRTIANPGVLMQELRTRHGVDDSHFEQQLHLVKRLERRKLIALGAGFLCIALLLVGSQLGGWDWG